MDPIPDAGAAASYHPTMEARIAKIEAVIPALATKEDMLRLEARMHQELHALTWKLIGVSGALVAAVFFIARGVH